MKIVFTGDFLRPSASSWRPTQHYNIRWLHDLFRPILSTLCSCDISYVAWTYENVQNGSVDSNDVAWIYDELKLSHDMNGWAKIYNRTLFPHQIQDLFSKLFKNSLIIGFEIPPYLKNYLIMNNIEFIDFIIHPVRFHDDIFFGIQSSLSDVNEILMDYSLDEREIFLAAGPVTAASRRSATRKYDPDSELFLLQTQHDKTQIQGDRFVGAIDFLASGIKKGLFQKNILLKPHPLELNNPHFKTLLCIFDKFDEVSENFYVACNNENVSRVISLSSSTSYEAKYFDREHYYLFKEPFDIFYSKSNYWYKPDNYISVKEDYFRVEFWVRILALVGMLSNRNQFLEKTQLSSKPNRLRIALKSFWGYNQVDTDLVPMPAVR